MLNLWIDNQLWLGAAQAALAAALAIVVMLIGRRAAIHLERETLVGLARGLVQIVAVGSVLGLLLRSPEWTAIILLALMMLAAATIAARRAQDLPGAFSVSLAAIAFGSGTVILFCVLTGVIEYTIASLIPVGSMLIANAMNTHALMMDRFRGEIEAHVGQIEAALALGGAPEQAALPYMRAAVLASLIPRVDTLRSLGIVWIPGIMAGMVLTGEDPIYAAIYQFVVIAIIFAAAGLTALAGAVLARDKVFTPAAQLAVAGKGR